MSVQTEASAPGGSSYLDALKVPEVARICAFGVISRLPDSMAGITLLLIARTHGGYALGGLLAGVLGIAATVSGPAWGRVADRRGPRTVLLLTGCGQSLALLALGPAIGHGAGLGLTAAVFAGILRPPAAGVVRAQWAALPVEARRVMQALESALTELVFVIGPVIVGLVLAFGTAGDSLVVAAVMVAGGCVGLATASTLRPGTPSLGSGQRRDLWGPLRSPALRLLCLVFFLQVTSFGGLEVGLSALCANAGEAALSGPLIGCWAVGSAIGGLAWGRRHRHGDPVRQLVVLTLMAGLLLGLFLVSGDPRVLFAIALPAGVSIAPGAQTVAGILAQAVPPEQHAEAYGWLSSAAPALGASVGYALAAVVAQTAGPRTAILVAVCVALLTPLAVLLRRRDILIQTPLPAF